MGVCDEYQHSSRVRRTENTSLRVTVFLVFSLVNGVSAHMEADQNEGEAHSGVAVRRL